MKSINGKLMGGNQISVKTLDLNTDFKNIKLQLDKIIEAHLEVSKEVI
jgi:hypothetical protein